jgi:hypothetical protein
MKREMANQTPPTAFISSINVIVNFNVSLGQSKDRFQHGWSAASGPYDCYGLS